MIEDEQKRKAREIEIEIFKARRAGISQEDRVRENLLDYDSLL